MGEVGQQRRYGGGRSAEVVRGGGGGGSRPAQEVQGGVRPGDEWELSQQRRGRGEG